jgi:hypothetical protein
VGGEPARRWGQGKDRGQSGADAGFVEVDAADAGCSDLGGQRQLIEGVVGQDADIDTVQGGGEAVDHAGELVDDLTEAVQDSAAAQLFGVVGNRFSSAARVRLRRNYGDQARSCRRGRRPGTQAGLVGDHHW